MDAYIVLFAMAIVALVLVFFFIIKETRPKKKSPFHPPNEKLEIIDLGKDKDQIEFLLSSGMRVCATSSAKIKEVVGLRIIWERMTVDVNLFGQEQSFARMVNKKEVAKLMWEKKFSIPCIERVRKIGENLSALNRALALLNKEPMPPMIIWAIDTDIDYYARFFRTLEDHGFDEFWQAVAPLLCLVDLQSGEIIEAQDDYAGAIVGLCFAKYDDR